MMFRDHRSPPLQTHGQYDEEWQPPAGGRFVSYGRSDEAWMRPLGLGRIQRTPKPLYDVRLKRSPTKLVGYANVNPVEFLEHSLGRVLTLAFMPPISASTPAYDITDPQIRPISVYADEILICNHRFVFWAVESERDAADLILGGWITVLGVDNIQRHCAELRHQYYRNRERNRSMLFPDRSLL